MSVLQGCRDPQPMLYVARTADTILGASLMLLSDGIGVGQFIGVDHAHPHARFAYFGLAFHREDILFVLRLIRH